MQDRIGKLTTPDSHVDGENGAKTIVYNTKRDSKEKGEKKKNGRKQKKEQKVEEIQQ